MDVTTPPSTIEVPPVSGAQAAQATDLVDHLVAKYEITPVDADALYNAMVTVYIRERQVRGDRPPSLCPLAEPSS